MLSEFASVGSSKSGTEINVTTPVDVMLNNDLSSPPLIVYVKGSPSESVAETVNADVWFSETEKDVVYESITGALLVL